MEAPPTKTPLAPWFRKCALLFVVVSILFLICVSSRLGGARLTDAVDDLGELMAALVAAGACSWAARRLQASRTAWALIASSALVWAAGEAVWSYYDLGRGTHVPFPSAADLGFLGAVPLAIAGLLSFPSARSTARSRGRGLLDAVLVAGSVFFVSWATVLGPLARQHEDGLLAQVVSLAYPISDIAIVSLVVILATRPGSGLRASLMLVMVGMIAFTVADSSFAYFTTVATYGIGNGLDAGWVVGYLLIALGALRAVAAPGPPSSSRPLRPTRWTVLGPYLPLTVASGVFIWRIGTGQPLRVVSQVVGFCLVVVMSIRQLLVLFDNLTLTHQLEVKVEERTAELHHRAFHDGLTGLANRALFTEHLNRAVQRRGRTGSELAVLFLDLDEFKQVNDLHGHSVGDRLLQAVAERLQRTLRTADTLARLGGDEFGVLLEGDPRVSDPAEAAQRILDSLEHPFRIGGTRLVIRASIGVATDRAAFEGADELLRDADLAMYAAKSKGRHGYELYTSAMESGILERMRLEAELQSAIDHQEFVLHYQPIIELSTGRPRAVEALIRWDHPRLGLIAPSEFIPASEATGLIVPIGAWVLNQACSQVQAWIEAGTPPVGLSVNLSPVQLADEHLPEMVATALANSGLDPAQLTLEITESVIIDQPDRAIARLRAIRSLGVKLAIDDFGTGYSSLAVLKDLPVDTLKIDRAFVTGISRSKAASNVARRILQLASDFQLHTVAEGVERRDQLQALRRLGCESVQGYLFSVPLEADEAGPFLLTQISA